MTATDTDLNALLERVKAATGPDSELDEAVAFATRFRPDQKHDRFGSFAHHEAKHDYGAAWIAHTHWRNEWGIPTYTASIDAALALTERVLPGWEWQVRKTGYVELHHPTHHLKDEVGYGDTAPLAILAATLSALIAGAKP